MRLYLSLLLSTLLPFLATATPPEEPKTPGFAVEDLGTQIFIVNVNSATFGHDADGNLKAFFVLFGKPARLVMTDVATATVEHEMELPNSEGGWKVIQASDGAVYVASNPHGHLYKYIPGEDKAEDLGKPEPGAKFIWSVVEGDGKIYAANYPDSTVVAFDPETHTFHNYGSMIEQEDYSRSIAWDDENNMVYVGIGTHAGLVKLNPETSEKQNILPGEWKDYQTVYTMEHHKNHLVGMLSPTHEVFVWNLETGEYKKGLPNLHGHGFSDLGPDGKSVYYLSGANLLRLDLDTFETEKTGATFDGSERAIEFFEEDGKSILYIAATPGRLMRFDPETGESKRSFIELPAQVVPIHSMAKGNDGKIYTSGYFSGGAARFDPATGEHEKLSGIGQSECIVAYGDQIYFGVYPDARIYSANANGEWKSKQLFALNDHQQDRPFALLAAEDKGKLFIGTVPDYGLLGGALTIYEPETDTHTVHRNVVEDHAIISLARSGNKVVGGTSVSGGLGVVPSCTEGKLFVWDIDKGAKTFETVPVPGKRAVTSLTAAPDGKVWGWAAGTLFIFDAEANEIVYQKNHFPIDYSKGSHVWRDAHMEMAPNGMFYGTISGSFFSLDPETRELVTINSTGERGNDELNWREMQIDDEGNFYVAKYDRLLRITLQNSPDEAGEEKSKE